MQDGTARRAGALAEIGLFALLLASAGTALAVDISGPTTARLGWTAASGPVVGYSVFVSRNGSLPVAPEQRVANPSATVSAQVGDSLVVWVEAYDATGNLGPASPSSDTLRFVAAPGTLPLALVEPVTLAASTPQGKSPASQSITVRNVGTGTLSYRVSASAGWIVPSPSAGTATMETDSISLAFSTAGLAMGTYSAEVSVTDTQSQAAKTVWILLNVVAPGPILSVEPAAVNVSVSLGQTAAGQALTIRNAGSDTLTYAVSGSAPWLNITNTTGSSTGESDSIPIGFSTSTLAAGTYTTTISVTAPGASGTPRAIPVTVVVSPPLLFELSPTLLSASVAHGHSPPSKSFTLRNPGGGAGSYSIVSDAGWLAADPRTGSSSGENDTITVRFDTASLPPGEHVATLRILSTSAQASALSVTLHVRPPAGDLDGDGVSDLFLWSRSKGHLFMLHHVLGPQLSGGQIEGGLPSDWQLLLTGDYDADGSTDLLWRSRANGAIFVCLMNDLEVKECGIPFTMPATHTLLGAADFNGDGRADISFRDPETGDVEICFMNGLSPAFCLAVASYPSAWPVTASGDHDGDGRADLVVQDPTDWKLQICGVLGPTAGTCTTPYRLPGAEIVATGDYDGDGVADLLWLRRSIRQLWLGFPSMTGAAAFRFLGALPANAEIVGSLDLDGDGRSEIVFQDPATGSVTVWIVSAYGIVEQIPFGVLGLDFTLGGDSSSQ
jgi:hypothetical protein